MSESIANLILWLFVINLGIAFGAGLYESRIAIPQWLSYSPESGYRWNAEAALQSNVGLRFWVYVTTVPLTFLTLASAIAADWTSDMVRVWWLGAVVAAIVDRVMTVAYFIPTMLKLIRNESFGEFTVVAKAQQWVKLGYLRHATTLIAWLAALKAFSLMGR
jgi:hypothetical protein